MSPESSPYVIPEQSTAETPSSLAAGTNWNLVLLVAIGIIIVVTLIAVFFVIPKYAEGALGSKVNAGLGGLNLGNDNGSKSNNSSASNGSNQGIAVGEPNPNGYDCTKNVYNCENFSTQGEAQVAFDSCINDGKGDIWGLDADGDGRVCESLG